MNEPTTQAHERDHNHVVFDAAMSDTRATLAEWGRRPGPVVTRWLLLSLAIAFSMLTGVWVVSLLGTPDPFVQVPNIFGEPRFEDAVRVFVRNSLVLALHAFVCIAGFMAMRTLPAQAELRHGFDRWIHHHAGRFTMVWVTGATLFSITTQVYILGHATADLAYVLNVQQWELLLTALPHAVLELTAVFLPLAAFMIASRRREWHQLLAATAVTVAIAVPMLIVAAAIEAYVWPSLLADLIV
jgi:hypothetical protein